MDDDTLFVTLSEMSTLELKSIRRTSLQYRRVIDDVLEQRWNRMIDEMMDEYVRSGAIEFVMAKADILNIYLSGQGTHIEFEIRYEVSPDDLDFLMEKATELVRLLIQNFFNDRLDVPGYPEELKQTDLKQLKITNMNYLSSGIRENLPNDEGEVRKRLRYYLDLLNITEFSILE